MQYFVAMDKKVAKDSDNAADEVRELSSEQLDKVAGGKDHSDCQDTYISEENCFHNDGCDLAYHYYPNYACSTAFSDGTICDGLIWVMEW